MKGVFTFFLLAASINSVVSESNDINTKIKAIRIVIKSDDLMKFDKSSINVEKNKPYEIILKNVGKLPKAAMGHNLIVLDTGNDALTFGGNWKIFDKDSTYTSFPYFLKIIKQLGAEIIEN